MSNKIRIILSSLSVLLLLNACEKDNNEVEEGPFFSLLEDKNIVIDTVPVASQNWEYGFAFKTLKKGKIKRLGLKLPTTGKFYVKLWDLSGPTPTLLAEKEIDSDKDHLPAFENIQSVALESNRKLGISIRANSFYRIQKKDSTAFDFPRKVGNISIESFHEESDPGANSFPSQTNSLRVAPCVNVIFVAE